MQPISFISINNFIKKFTMVKALRQLASATLLVAFSVMQLTMDLHETIQGRP